MRNLENGAETALTAGYVGLYTIPQWKPRELLTINIKKTYEY